MTAHREAAAWLMHSARFTAFSQPPPLETLLDWWNSVIPGLPENQQSQPRVGIHVLSSPFQAGLLSLKTEPARIDWALEAPAPTIDSVQQDQSFPNAGLFFHALPEFKQAIAPWFPRCPATHRLAFGAELILVVASAEEAYKTLSRYLPAVKLDHGTSSDFLYRINRPRDSSIPGYRINRLSTWAAIKWDMRVALGRSIDQMAPAVAQSGYAVKLDLDINTLPAASPIPVSVVPAIAAELIAFATEIAQNGDLP